MSYIHYKTDINNWGQGLILKGCIILDNTHTFEQVFEIAKNVNAPIIIKTPAWRGRSGQWYIKGTGKTNISYDEIKKTCEENNHIGWKKTRDCYLIRY